MNGAKADLDAVPAVDGDNQKRQRHLLLGGELRLQGLINRIGRMGFGHQRQSLGPSERGAFAGAVERRFAPGIEELILRTRRNGSARRDTRPRFFSLVAAALPSSRRCSRPLAFARVTLSRPPSSRAQTASSRWTAAMCKIEQVHSGAACAAPAGIMRRAIEQAAAPVADVSLSNQIDGRTSWSRYVRDPRCRSPASTAMPLPQPGWCRILLRR